MSSNAKYQIKKAYSGLYYIRYIHNGKRRLSGAYVSRDDAERQIDHWEDMDAETDERVLQAYGEC